MNWSRFVLPTVVPKVAEITVVNQKKLPGVARPWLGGVLLIVTPAFDDAQVTLVVRT